MVTTQTLRLWHDASQRAHAMTAAALQQANDTRRMEKIGVAIALHHEARTPLHAWRREYDERGAQAEHLFLGFARGAQLANRYEPTLDGNKTKLVLQVHSMPHAF